jgi:pyruvate-formate lyase-activating enzyme
MADGQAGFCFIRKNIAQIPWRLQNETSIWFEVTNIMIPGENNDPGETQRMCDWLLQNLGDSVPLHFTAFHPDFKMTDKPRTPATTRSPTTVAGCGSRADTRTRRKEWQRTTARS